MLVPIFLAAAGAIWLAWIPLSDTSDVSQRAGKGLPWHESGEASGGQQAPRGHAVKQKEAHATAGNVSTARAVLVFAAAAW